MRNGSTLRSTDGSAVKMPTSACRCGECSSKGQSWSGDSGSADGQIIPIYACLRSGGPQNREMCLICARLRIAGLQIREMSLICARLRIAGLHIREDRLLN
jgi:hypothetical protein